MWNLVKRFWADEQGTETVEWAVIIGLIALAVIALAISIGGHVERAFTKLDAGLESIP